MYSILVLAAVIGELVTLGNHTSSRHSRRYTNMRSHAEAEFAQY